MAMKPAELQQGRIAMAMLRQALTELQPIAPELMCAAVVVGLIRDAAAMLGSELITRAVPPTGKEIIRRPKPNA